MATESAEPSRGQVWLVRLDSSASGESGKSRPAIIVSVDELQTGSGSDLFVVVPISATAQGSRLRPALVPRDGGVQRASVAVPHAIRAVSRSRLLRHVGDTAPGTLKAVEQALAVILGLDA